MMGWEDCTHIGAEVIGVEVRSVHDGVLFYQCRKCGVRWHRFEPGSELRKKAEPYVMRHPFR